WLSRCFVPSRPRSEDSWSSSDRFIWASNNQASPFSYRSLTTSGSPAPYDGSRAVHIHLRQGYGGQVVAAAGWYWIGRENVHECSSLSPGTRHRGCRGLDRGRCVITLCNSVATPTGRCVAA